MEHALSDKDVFPPVTSASGFFFFPLFVFVNFEQDSVEGTYQISPSTRCRLLFCDLTLYKHKDLININLSDLLHPNITSCRADERIGIQQLGFDFIILTDKPITRDSLLEEIKLRVLVSWTKSWTFDSARSQPLSLLCLIF